MHPLLFGRIPLYLVMWVCAAAVSISVGSYAAARHEFPPGRSAVAVGQAAVSILLGSKLLYLVEARWFPLDDYVANEMRGALHGFRIPGGILLLPAVIPIICRWLRLPWREFGDALIPLVALSLVFIRIGCFLNGCCFGKVSDVPWAVAFPRGSWVYYYHRLHGWIPASAQVSLPVHPLELYFLLAAAVTGVVVLKLQRRNFFPGYVQLVFYTLFFASTACLEPLRENFLTLNNWINPLGAVVAGGVLLGREFMPAVKRQVAA